MPVPPASPCVALPQSAGPDVDLAARLFGELRARTADGRGVTRASYGSGESLAHGIVRGVAERLGLAVSTDAGGNLYMTRRGATRDPAVFIGSHLDSVPVGGNFDGAAGVLLGMAVLSGYARHGIVPERDVTVMAIRAEESTWFGASYIGSRAAFGLLTPEELDGVRRSSDRVALGAAIDAAGGDSAALRAGAAHLDPRTIGLFIEPHIEQGPVLVAEDIPLGIVTGIRGSFRYRTARCTGAYAHSGTTPREGRRDAVRAVATLVLRMDALWETLAAEGRDVTVTFGQFATDPAEAAFSKVAGRVDFCVDVRSREAETLLSMRTILHREVARIACDHGVSFDLGPLTDSDPASMDAGIVAALMERAGVLGIGARAMACGAGHDAAVFAARGVPSGMVFIRNANGSHNPDEAMEMDDFAKAAHLLFDFCRSPTLPSPSSPPSSETP